MATVSASTAELFDTCGDVGGRYTAVTMRSYSRHGVPRGVRLAPERMARAVGLAMDVGVSCVERLLVYGRGERVHRRAV